MRLFITTVVLTAFCQTNAQDLRLQADNIEEIVAAMTLEEKAHLLVGADDEVGERGNIVTGAAGSTHAIPRLGIPTIVLTDGPAGVRISSHHDGIDQTYYGTGFPVGIALASTWNTELVEAVGSSIGNEVLEYGCDVLLAPGMNIHRTPLCGRNFEYYSEDPVLSGRIAAAYVRGIQSQGVGTSIKHFAANSQETNRINVDEVISQRALRELYLRPFEIAIHESDPWTVMSSYNKINGIWTQSSRDLLHTILRNEWGYKGLVMTDWTNERRPSYERVTAGNALLMPGHKWQEEDIIAHVKDGSLPMAEMDARVREMLRLIVRAPRFRGYKYSDRPDLEAHAKVTRQSATEGMVLLKNSLSPSSILKGNSGYTLPLNQGIKVALFGITSYDFIAGGTGSGNVNKPYVIDLKTGLENAGYKLNDEVSRLYNTYKAHVDAERRARGANGGRYAELAVGREVLKRQAEQNDVAIFTIGRQAGEGGDRHIDGDFNLTNDEYEMLQNLCLAFHTKGKPVIVILNMGNAIETASWKAMPDAILMAWQPGQEGGNSVADVLSGKASPSGKLTMTFPNTISDHPACLNFPTGPAAYSDRLRNQAYTFHEEGIYVGYRFFTTSGRAVSYPFGYGLSYTSFQYSNAKVSSTKDGVTASITVTNTGKNTGKEVVQLYVKAPLGCLPDKPVRELKAFGKTRELQPGERQTLTFKISSYELASFNEQQSQWETAAGQYDVQFAASSEDIRAHATFHLKKTLRWPTHHVLQRNDLWKSPTGLSAV
ncbi:MAG: beta-glucosidase [Prevotella sp.]|nr:beta-glucosidase [Prevotella sp.]